MLWIVTRLRARNDEWWVCFLSHCEEWNDEAVYRLPRADALAMTGVGRNDSLFLVTARNEMTKQSIDCHALTR